MDELISKQDTLDAISRIGLTKCSTKEVKAVDECLEEVKKLQSVTEPKTGHWITHEEQFNALGMAVKGGVKCSECGYTTHNKLHMEIGCPYKFCPDCGCRMVETQKEE